MLFFITVIMASTLWYVSAYCEYDAWNIFSAKGYLKWCMQLQLTCLSVSVKTSSLEAADL